MTGVVRKETQVHNGERTVRAVIAVTIICAAGALLIWGMGRGVAQDEPIGRYQVAAPDLLLDTMTGRLVDGNGRVLEGPIDPSGEEVGRYAAAGYVTAVTRRIGLDVINQPIAYPELVKGYVLIDTKTGQVLRSKTYYAQPLEAGDF
jgi:hypothetical protein